MKKRICGIIGLGHVGAHVASAITLQGIADELVLVDMNPEKLKSEVQDLRDAVAYMPHRVTVRAGDFADLGDCAVIVNSVGKIDLLRSTHNRVTEMDFTIPAVRGYAEKIKASGFDKYYIDHTLAIWPQAASGEPFSASQLQSTGDTITDLYEDMAAEQKARLTYDNILRIVKDPEVAEPIRFLREREIVHFQRFGECLRRTQENLDCRNFYAFNQQIDKKNCGK